MMDKIFLIAYRNRLVMLYLNAWIVQGNLHRATKYSRNRSVGYIHQVKIGPISISFHETQMSDLILENGCTSRKTVFDRTNI